MVKYDFSDHTLYFFENPDVLAAEPGTADKEAVVTAFSEIASVVIDQANSTIELNDLFKIDEIKIVKDWWALKDPVPVE